MKHLLLSRVLFASTAVFGLADTCAAQAQAATITEITLPGSQLYMESITSLKDGTLIVGSIGKGTVSRIRYGSTDVEEWIKEGTHGLHAVYGVFADEPHKNLWVCSNKDDSGAGFAEIKTFDLETGAFKDSHPLPALGDFCNDTAVAADGTAYIANTRGNTLLMLKPGAANLELASGDPLMAGVDGVTFLEKDVLLANSVTKGRLLRIRLGSDGKAASVTELKLSRALDGPDGMRALGKNQVLLAENRAGIMSIVTITGDTAEVKNLKEGLIFSAGVTATRGMAWVAETKLNYKLSPALKGQSPDPFKLYAVPLTK